MTNKYQNMKLKYTIILCLFVLNFSIAQTKVIGYVPNWIDLNVFSKSIQYNKLTHLNLAFENPDANGNLSFQAGSDAIIQMAHSKNVKVFVSLGGGAVSEGGAIRDNYFNLISAANRASFVQKIADYVNNHNFDGVDVDLEGPAINGDYGNFIIDLAAKLHTNNKLISAALSQAYGGANVPVSTFSSFDWINIMAYDATGPWNPSNPGQHSPYSLAVDQFNYWTGRGLPKNKTIIGVPFYGYGFGSAANQGMSFSDIVTAYPGAENTDQVGNTIYYNGIPTIKQKTTFALQNAGGIMIWQLAQDAVGAKSLLSAIHEVIAINPPSTDVITVYKDCNYGGYTVGLPVGGYTTAQLESKGIRNNDISSLKVQSGYEALAFSDDNFTGSSLIFSADDNCLVDNGYNDVVSSIQVRVKSSSFSRLIQAEDYSTMSGIQTEATTDTGGGLNVGYTNTGDWLAYNNINFPTTGSYLLEYRVASAISGSAISSDLNAGAVQLGSLTVPNTGGWQNWQTISHTISINAGAYNFGVFIQSSGVNLNWIKITKVGAASMVAQADTIEDSKATINIYPNPVETTLFFSSDITGAKVSILNSQMGSLSEYKVNNNGVDVSELKAGVYSIIMEKDGERTEIRFIKN
jgi:chitinase